MNKPVSWPPRKPSVVSIIHAKAYLDKEGGLARGPAGDRSKEGGDGREGDSAIDDENYSPPSTQGRGAEQEGQGYEGSEDANDTRAETSLAARYTRLRSPDKWAA
jgi:hypothetical protein